MKLGPKDSGAAHVLLPLLKNSDWDVSTTAVDAISQIVGRKDEFAIQALIDFIRHGRKQLDNLNYPDACTLEQSLFGSRINYALDLATLTLGWIGNSQATTLLQELARTGNTEAIISLGYLRDSHSVIPLLSEWAMESR